MQLLLYFYTQDNEHFPEFHNRYITVQRKNYRHMRN